MIHDPRGKITNDAADSPSLIPESPPSYESTVDAGPSSTAMPSMSPMPTLGGKGSPYHALSMSSQPVAMYGATAPSAGVGSPMVYHYQNPITGDHVASLLPPDHPEMICLQEGAHVRQSRFGLLGVIAAVVWFPLGVGLCLLDRRVQCKRCGKVIEDGLCG
ncbi:hypothetical protein EVG20_g5348 [Dentipellis fragilis]|uniref:Uncharacterized protein n=1 Tax=Dentipellis fragilis TaxID=205917 RepID=A0A4Y9YX76_9AGAM|nr:hypothetical protein EVG20_g5348 [Dentipellis fragilis]